MYRSSPYDRANLIADFDLTMALSGYTCCRELDACALCRSDLA